MRQSYIFLILGIWVAVLPFLGFPYSWKDVLTTVTGLAIAYVSYFSYRAAKMKEIREEKTFDNFSENTFTGEEEIDNNNHNS
jgi:hypothetical protein